MDFWRSVNGMVSAETESADISALFAALNDAGITIYQVVKTDELTVQFSFDRRDYRKIKRVTQKRGESLRLKAKTGLYWTGKRFLRRPVLAAGVLLLFLLTCLIPSRIWFFRVEGNQNIPTNLILEKAEECGISFGASRREVRSEKLKNALLEALPQLQWAGINTSGCVATISVTEREQPIPKEENGGISSIVAVRDGVILSCTVTKGSAACRIGQAVKSGELLISGYTDCGLSIQATQADGEVFARTSRQITAVAPTEYRVRKDTQRQIEKYSLIIGKKRINFFQDSGILDSSCVKMTYEEKLILPGGFVLPVTLVREVWTYFDCADETEPEQDVRQQLTDFASDYLSGHMIAGEILASSETVSTGDGLICLDGLYACREMIGRVQKEEIIAPNGKYD